MILLACPWTGATQDLAHHCQSFSSYSCCTLERAGLSLFAVPPGSVCAQQTWFWRDRGSFHISLLSISKGGTQTVVRRHSLRNSAVTSTVRSCLPTQTPCKPVSLRQHLFIFFSNPGQGLAYPVSASRKGGTSWEPCLSAGRSPACSAQRHFHLFITALF